MSLRHVVGLTLGVVTGMGVLSCPEVARAQCYAPTYQGSNVFGAIVGSIQSAQNRAACEQAIRDQQARAAYAAAAAQAQAQQAHEDAVVRQQQMQQQAAAEGRRQAAARAQAQKLAIEKAKAADDAEKAAEMSPDNICREPDAARSIMAEFNDFDMIKRAHAKVVDIEHLVTIKADKDTHEMVCHGSFMMTNGVKLTGTFSIRPNVAGDLISSWKLDR